jgi:hypothetical protein
MFVGDQKAETMLHAVPCNQPPCRHKVGKFDYLNDRNLPTAQYSAARVEKIVIKALATNFIGCMFMHIWQISTV